MNNVQAEDRIKYARMRIRRLKEKIAGLEGWLNEPSRVVEVRKAILSSKTAIYRWERIIREKEEEIRTSKVPGSAP